jgi:hypothetical protein
VVGLFEKKKQAETGAADAKVYYSTAFGDTKDSKQKLFCVNAAVCSTFLFFAASSRSKSFMCG